LICLNSFRRSPTECTGAIKTPIQGNPDMAHISTSDAEPNNLNVRPAAASPQRPDPRRQHRAERF